MLSDVDLKGRRVLVGVSASISIYKSLELIRLCIKSGASVRVVLSEDAKRFITALTFEALSENVVLHNDTESWANDNNHIAIGKWAEVFVIAPATANTLNKLSNGIADNLLTQVALAYKGVKVVAPSANTNMINNPITKVTMKMLKLNDYVIVEPVSKTLVCKDEGVGALADVKDIFLATARELLKEPHWEHRRVIVSGGGTVEKLDDVRYISNFSSGKMANALSTALYLRGADVCFASSVFLDELPSNVHQIEASSVEEMHEYLIECIRVAKKGVMRDATLMNDSIPEIIQKTPYLYMAAAVSDYTPSFPQSGKMKKEMMGDVWNIEMKKSMDILASLNKEGIVTVGFKAEMDKEKAYENARGMLEKKEIDAVCLNIIDENNPFGGDQNEVLYITKDENISLGRASKLEIAFGIVDTSVKHAG